MGEQIARELAAEGMPIVVVNPSAPIGPRDVKPTPTGRIIVDFLNHRIPAYLDTGLNWVHVRDVATGHILAAKKGKVGERYILGHAQGNWTMKQTMEVLGELSGMPASKRQIPFWLAMTLAQFGEGLAWLTGKPPRVPVAGVRMARHKMWFSPAKAIRELGLPQTHPKEAFREAIEWFKKQGGVG
jgi:dihydroflavonol-4-reductase